MAVEGEAFIDVHALFSNLEKEMQAGVASAARKVETSGGAAISVDADLTKLSRGLQNIGSGTGALGGLGTRVSQLTTGFTQLGDAGIGAALPIAGLTAGIAAAGVAVGVSLGEFESLTREVRLFQDQTGASAEEASQFVFAAKEMGVNAETLRTAVGRLARNIDEGKVNFQSLGIEIGHFSNGTTDLIKTFSNVADAFKNARDPIEANDLAFKSFGRGMAQLVPILALGGQGLQQLFDQAKGAGQLFNQADIDAGFQLELSIRAAKLSVEGLAASVGRIAAPTVSHFATDLSGAVDAITHLITRTDESKSAQLDWGGAIVHGLSVLNPFADALDKLGEKKRAEIQDSITLQDQIAKETKNLEEEAQATEIAATAAFNYAGAQLAADAAGQQVEEAQNRLTAAQQSVTDATNKTTDAILKEEKASLALRRAQEAVEAAAHRISDADAAVAKAKTAVADAEFREGVQSQDAVDARQKLSDAVFDQTKAHQDLKDAQDEQTIKQQENTQAQVKSKNAVKDADLKLREAETGLQEAIDRKAKADAEAQVVADAVAGKTDDARVKTELYTKAYDSLVKSLGRDVPTPLLDKILATVGFIAGAQPSEADARKRFPGEFSGPGQGPGDPSKVTVNQTNNISTNQPSQSIQDDLSWLVKSGMNTLRNLTG